MPVYDSKAEWGGVYTFLAQDMGAGNITKRIPCPVGKRPHIREVAAHVTETFTEDTTPGSIEIGVAGDTDAYFEVTDLGTTAAATTLSSTDTSGIFADALTDNYGEKDTDVLITLTAPTGGTPAGILDLFITITWV